MTGGSGLDIHLREVVHLYPSIDGEVVALQGVDLDVSAGESVALVGPSGAGKSTVLGLVAGSFAASAGQVLIGGEDVGRMSGARLARLRALDVSLVVQGAERNLLPYATAVQNVWYARRGAHGRGRDPGVSERELLELFDLGRHSDTPVHRLAPGERQQVALVAGLAPMTPVLLLDEPTSRLGVEDRETVVDLLLRICRELAMTVVMVTHDPDLARRFPRAVTIRDGRVGAEGRAGVDHAKIGREGLVQLPREVLDLLPPQSLVEVIRHHDRVELRPIRDDAHG